MIANMLRALNRTRPEMVRRMMWFYALQPKDADAAKPLLEPIPDMEWWDVRICTDGASYDAMAAAASGDEFLLRDKITNLVSLSAVL